MPEPSFEIRRNWSLWDKVGISFKGKSLHNAIESGFPYDVFVKTASLTEIDRRELSAYLSIAPSTLNRRAKVGQLSTAESDRLYRILNVLGAATDLFEGNQEAAIVWLRTNNKGLGNKSPIEMISTTAGYENAMNIIGRLEHGFTA